MKIQKYLLKGKYTAKLKSHKNAAMGWDQSESKETTVPFKIGELVIYEPPVLTAPRNNSIAGLEDILNGNFIFKWNHSPLLNEYEITISESIDFDRNLSVF